MGYAGVTDVRQGKFFEVELSGGTPEAARATVEEISRKVLANPVIESFRVEIE
jgi:phosphoribosylformylglycinamidine synthase